MTTVKYSTDHEYVRLEGDIAVIGISVHAQQQLGDVVFVEAPEVGRKLKAGEPAAVVESVKAASDVYSPLSGEVVAVNDAVVKNPALVNEDAEGAAWFFKLKPSDKSEFDALMDAAAYATYAKGLA